MLPMARFPSKWPLTLLSSLSLHFYRSQDALRSLIVQNAIVKHILEDVQILKHHRLSLNLFRSMTQWNALCSLCPISLALCQLRLSMPRYLASGLNLVLSRGEDDTHTEREGENADFHTGDYCTFHSLKFSSSKYILLKWKTWWIDPEPAHRVPERRRHQREKYRIKLKVLIGTKSADPRISDDFGGSRVFFLLFSIRTVTIIIFLKQFNKILYL